MKHQCCTSVVLPYLKGHLYQKIVNEETRYFLGAQVLKETVHLQKNVKQIIFKQIL